MVIKCIANNNTNTQCRQICVPLVHPCSCKRGKNTPSQLAVSTAHHILFWTISDRLSFSEKHKTVYQSKYQIHIYRQRIWTSNSNFERAILVRGRIVPDKKHCDFSIICWLSQPSSSTHTKHLTTEKNDYTRTWLYLRRSLSLLVFRSTVARSRSLFSFVKTWCVTYPKQQGRNTAYYMLQRLHIVHIISTI